MKKLLSLLCVLTISGTAIPTTIAASPYQKEEKLNIDFNLQKNNISGIITKFRGVPGSFNHFGLVLNNKIYSGLYGNKVYQYDTATGQQKIVIVTNGQVWSSGVALNNKVYFGSNDHNVYEYDITTERQKIVVRTNDIVNSSGVALNNKVYFGSNDHNVYEYDITTGQQKVVINTEAMVSSSGVTLNNKFYFFLQVLNYMNIILQQDNKKI